MTRSERLAGRSNRIMRDLENSDMDRRHIIEAMALEQERRVRVALCLFVGFVFVVLYFVANYVR